MSASLYMSGPYERLAIEADADTLTIRTRDQYGLSINRVSIRLTSADVAALRIALDLLDTTAADDDTEAEREAA